MEKGTNELLDDKILAEILGGITDEQLEKIIREMPVDELIRLITKYVVKIKEGQVSKTKVQGYCKNFDKIVKPSDYSCIIGQSADPSCTKCLDCRYYTVITT